MTRLLSAPLNAYDAVLFKASSVLVMPCPCFNVSSGAAMIITRLAHYRNIYHQQFTIAASIIPMSQLTIARCVPNKRQAANLKIIESVTSCVWSRHNSHTACRIWQSDKFSLNRSKGRQRQYLDSRFEKMFASWSWSSRIVQVCPIGVLTMCVRLKLFCRWLDKLNISFIHQPRLEGKDTLMQIWLYILICLHHKTNL